jgi:hypothetical protein
MKMAEAGPALSRHDLEAKIVKRCWQDEGFCKEFTSDPTGSFVKYLKIPETELPKIVIHEESVGSWHIVLPATPGNAAELSEADLERIAGGTTSIASVVDSMVWLGTAVVKSVSAGMAAGLTASGGVLASAIVSANEGW